MHWYRDVVVRGFLKINFCSKVNWVQSQVPPTTMKMYCVEQEQIGNSKGEVWECMFGGWRSVWSWCGRDVGLGGIKWCASPPHGVLHDQDIRFQENPVCYRVCCSNAHCVVEWAVVADGGIRKIGARCWKMHHDELTRVWCVHTTLLTTALNRPIQTDLHQKSRWNRPLRQWSSSNRLLHH